MANDKNSEAPITKCPDGQNCPNTPTGQCWGRCMRSAIRPTHCAAGAFVGQSSEFMKTGRCGWPECGCKPLPSAVSSIEPLREVALKCAEMCAEHSGESPFAAKLMVQMERYADTLTPRTAGGIRIPPPGTEAANVTVSNVAGPAAIPQEMQAVWDMLLLADCSDPGACGPEKLRRILDDRQPNNHRERLGYPRSPAESCQEGVEAGALSEVQEKFGLNRPLMMFLKSVPIGYKVHFAHHTFVPLDRYCAAAAWVIEQLSAPSAMVPKWIPVSERLPSEDGGYLVYMPSQSAPETVSHFRALDKEWGLKYATISHWMALPNAPTDDTTKAGG